MAGGSLGASSAAADGGKLFPDRQHFFLFCLIVTLFVNQGILVTASKNADGGYDYNTTTVVILTELTKLIIAVWLFLRDHKWDTRLLLSEVAGNSKLFGLYLVPAFLYCLYNNLAFVNLKHYDPASYFLLLNFRTVLTGIIFQFLFSKKLGSRQWLALIVLTSGCVVKQVDITDGLSNINIKLDFHLLLMMTQVFCSCFAGVYNEFLLKDTGAGVHIQVQNVFMYVNSIVMNVGFMGYNGTLSTALSPLSVASVIKPGVLIIALNNGVAGITTSLFLKKFNSILKTFAGAIELLLTAVAAWILFGVAINGLMLLSIGLVSVAMYLYSTQPVINKSKDTEKKLDGVKIGQDSKPVLVTKS